MRFRMHIARLDPFFQNIHSDNPEDWKNAVVSCRTLLMDMADIFNPSKELGDKDKYINRLKDFVSTKEDGKTGQKLFKTYLEEIKKRIELVSDLTQGGAHKDRPTLVEAQNVVLYTYMIISDLVEIYSQKKKS